MTMMVTASPDTMTLTAMDIVHALRVAGFVAPEAPIGEAQAVVRALLLASESSALAKVERLRHFDVHTFVADYEHRDPDHTPTEAERAMLEDFGNGLLAAAFLKEHSDE